MWSVRIAQPPEQEAPEPARAKSTHSKSTMTEGTLRKVIAGAASLEQEIHEKTVLLESLEGGLIAYRKGIEAKGLPTTGLPSELKE